MAPVWSRTTAPISLLFSVLKIAPSKFILMNLASGGFHIAFGFGTAANFSFACGTSWSKMQQGWWLQTWFRWCQIPQIIVANSSGLPWLLRIHDSNSIPIETILSWVRSKTTAHVKEFRLHSSIVHTASLLLCVSASGLILWEWLHDRHATGSFWPCSELANPRCFSTDWSLHSVLPQA